MSRYSQASNPYRKSTYECPVPCTAVQDICTRASIHLKAVGLGIDVADIHSTLVAKQELLALTVGVDAHVVLVGLLVGNKRFDDKCVQYASNHFHLL